MNYVTVVEDDKHPLRHLELRYDGPRLAQLCEDIGDDRRRRFGKIVISGGVAVKSGWRGSLKQVELLRSQASKFHPKDSLVLGYFHPRHGEIKLFPEAHLQLAIHQQRSLNRSGHLPDQDQVLDTMHHQFYQTLIEEIEHGYQEPQQSQYQSLISKFVTFTSPLMLLMVFLAVAYIILMGLSYWWIGLVFGLMMSWIFLPVWVSLIPTPRWYQRLRYRFNQRENDAKGKAVSIKFIRQAREAIWFELRAARRRFI